MPKKKTTETNPDSVETGILYTGRMDTGNHRYFRTDTKDPVYFNKKLQRNHEIGEVYPVTITGNMFSTNRKDEPIGSHDNAVEVANWVKTDAMTAQETKRVRERRNYEKLAREAVKGLRLVYRRAHNGDQRAIIRALVNALEAE